MRRLTEGNRWWREQDWARDDRDLRPLTHVPFEYAPDPLSDIVPGGLYVLRGPRRVGKSVEVKRAVAGLIRRGVAPRRIVHLACDELSKGDLARLYRVARETLTRGLEEPRYWFLDEITSVPGWPAAIKNLRDNTALAEDCVVLTGSSARDLDEATKSLAGRRGPAKDSDRVLLPMSFRSFSAAIGLTEMPALPAISPSRFVERSTEEALFELVPWLAELASLWELYLRAGGFPRAVADQLSQGDVQPVFVRSLWDVFHGDALKTTGMEAAASHSLLVRLIKSLGDTLNMSTVAEEIGVQSHETAKGRVRALVQSYLVWPCHRRGDHDLPNLDARSKYYFIDPLLARIARLRLAQSPEADTSRLSEQQLGIALLRRLESEQPGSYADFTSIMYARAASAREVDFVGPRLGRLGYEGKYVDHRWRQESLTLKAQCGRGVIATRSVLDMSGPIWAVPAGMLAWLLSS